MHQRLRIAHLYPEQMNIYGDRGNIITLTQRCLWRGIEVDVLPVNVGTVVDWADVDLAFFGGGQDSGQALIAEDFVARQGPALRQAIDDGLVTLAICGGYQLLGHYFLTFDGQKLPGVGALDVHTVGGDVRLIGNIVIEANVSIGVRVQGSRVQGPGSRVQGPTTRFSFAVESDASTLKLVGFENHSGRTYLGQGVQPLGRVLVGHGNNGEDGTEGATYRNTIGCYMHGSLLPKNPQLADYLIGLALERRYGNSALVPLDNTLELRAQHRMIERLVRR